MGTIRRVVLVASLVAAGAMVVPTVASAKTLTYPSSACPKSSTGLQDCINKASNGDTITVKPGTYYEQNIVVNHSVTLTGKCGHRPTSVHPPSSVIDAGDSGTFGDGFDIGASKVTIECLVIRHAGASHYGINNDYVGGPFAHLTVKGVWIVDSEYAIYQGGAPRLKVMGSTLLGTSSYGIYQLGTSNGDTIAGNTIGHTDSYGLYFSDTGGSSFKKNSIGPADGVGLYIDGGNNNLVSGNSLHSVESDCIEFSSTHTTVTANTFNGCDDTGIYTDVNDATVTNNVFHGKVDGDVIELDCSDNAVVSGNKQPSGGTDDDPFIYACNSSSSSIEITNNVEKGFVEYGVECSTCYDATVTGNSATGGGEEPGVYVDGTHPVVDNNRARGGFDSEGIYVDCTSGCDGSSVSGNTESQCSDGCPGYYVATSGCSSFPCMTIAHNSASDNVEYGFELATSYAKISDNTASANGYTYAGCDYGGFYLNDGGHNHLLGNVATSNACEGFVIYESNDLLKHNSASGNVAHGFEVGSSTDSNNRFFNNTSTGNFGDGFNNDGTSTSFIANSASHDRQDCTSDSLEGATTNTLTGNHCADHTNFAVNSKLTAW